MKTHTFLPVGFFCGLLFLGSVLWPSPVRGSANLPWCKGMGPPTQVPSSEPASGSSGGSTGGGSDPAPPANACPCKDAQGNAMQAKACIPDTNKCVIKGTDTDRNVIYQPIVVQRCETNSDGSCALRVHVEEIGTAAQMCFLSNEGGTCSALGSDGNGKGGRPSDLDCTPCKVWEPSSGKAHRSCEAQNQTTVWVNEPVAPPPECELKNIPGTPGIEVINQCYPDANDRSGCGGCLGNCKAFQLDPSRSCTRGAEIPGHCFEL